MAGESTNVVLGPDGRVPHKSTFFTGKLKVSVVTAAYNEAVNLPVLYDRVTTALERLDADWEWIVVDDHSDDETATVIETLAARDARVRGVRLSRNFGSHLAIACGLTKARGKCAIVLAADLQDPPEVFPEMIRLWRQGTEVVWAVRRSRDGERMGYRMLARLYYAMMRHVVGMKAMPPNGADFFLLGRRAVDAVCTSDEANGSILGLITWMGFSQASIAYDKQPRLRGRSGWSVSKKLKLVADSVTAFSYFPIRLMSLLGVLFAIGGFGLAAVTVVERLLGLSPSPSGVAMIITILLLGFGFIMMFLGILGEYLWRTFDEVRGRPRYIVERNIGGHDPPPATERHTAFLQSKSLLVSAAEPCAAPTASSSLGWKTIPTAP